MSITVPRPQKRTVIIMFLVVSLLLPGCQTSGVEVIMRDDRGFATFMGYLAAAIAVGFMSRRSREWAPLIIAGGSALGYVIGDVIASKREQMIRDRDFVLQELDETDEAIVKVRERNEALGQAVDDLRRSIDELHQMQGRSFEQRQQRSRTIELLDEALESNEAQAERITDAITYLETMRRDSQVLTDGAAARLDQQIATLRTELAELESELDALANLRVRAVGI